jgi:hypothetical protein
VRGQGREHLHGRRFFFALSTLTLGRLGEAHYGIMEMEMEMGRLGLVSQGKEVWGS